MVPSLLGNGARFIPTPSWTDFERLTTCVLRSERKVGQFGPEQGRRWKDVSSAAARERVVRSVLEKFSLRSTYGSRTLSIGPGGAGGGGGYPCVVCGRWTVFARYLFSSNLTTFLSLGAGVAAEIKSEAG